MRVLVVTIVEKAVKSNGMMMKTMAFDHATTMRTFNGGIEEKGDLGGGCSSHKGGGRSWKRRNSRVYKSRWLVTTGAKSCSRERTTRSPGIMVASSRSIAKRVVAHNSLYCKDHHRGKIMSIL